LISLERRNAMKSSTTPTIIAVTALVVSVLAATPLGHAAGRLVLAKSSVGTKQLKKNAVTSIKVKNGSLLATDFKAGQLPSGPQGLKGDKGEPGAAGSALGYAHVIVTVGGATVDSSRSKNVTQANVNRFAQGITCVSGLPFEPKSVTVTTDASTGFGIENATAALAPDVGVVQNCGAAAQAIVVTGQGNTARDVSYYAVFN
jgi:hypothetical protein